jgi:NAD(P)H-dependent FMN reductase
MALLIAAQILHDLFSKLELGQSIPYLVIYSNDHSKAWAAKIDSFDAFVFVIAVEQLRLVMAELQVATVCSSATLSLYRLKP